MSLENKVTIRQSILIAIVLIALSLIEGCGPDLASRKDLQVKGKFVAKFKSTRSDCVGSIVIKTKLKVDTLNDVCICSQPRGEIWEYLLPNDSILKEKGSLVWYVVRANKKQAFEYPSCYR